MTRSITKFELTVFSLLGAVSIFSVLAAFIAELYYLALIPFGLVIIFLGFTNFKLLYFLLLFTIPFSIEYSFSGSLGTDLPDEPLMVGLMVITLVFSISNYKLLPTGFFGNLIIFALLLHLFWILVSAVASVSFGVSFKIFIAKIWYVTSFTVLSAMVIRTKEDLKRAFWCIYIPLTLLIVQVIIRHAMQKFSFDEINKPMYPFFRNHVNYAAILSIFFPFILLVRTWYEKGSLKRWLLNFSVLFYIVAIYLSYTRTCYLALLAIAPFYFVVRFKLMKPALTTFGIAITVLMIYLFNNNNYLKFAPTFEDTILHDELGDHLSSTFEGKDVSSMERVYRWVAGARMFQEHPYMGFGPGTFYPNYKKYTVTSFETYVSDNPERSSAHNQALLILTEQGAIGLTIFLFLYAVVFIQGEKIYHRLKDETDKNMVMTLLIVMAMVFVNLTLSDMLESDKVGPFFFMGLSLIAAIDMRNRSLLKAESK